MKRLLAVLLFAAIPASAQQVTVTNPTLASGSVTGGSVTLGGNLVTGGAFTQAGAFATTITATATTNSTLPAGTHSIAPLDAPVFTGSITASGGIAVTGGTPGAAVSTITNTANFMVFNGGSAGYGFNSFDNGVAYLGLTPTLASSGLPWTLSNAAIKMTALATGTNADTVCWNANGTLQIQAAACTISSMRFKNLIGGYKTGSALGVVAKLEPIVFTMKPMERPNPDANYDRPQIGLSAENVAAIEPRCAIYEDDGVTPKSYRQECLIAVLVAGMQAQQREIKALKAR